MKILFVVLLNIIIAGQLNSQSTSLELIPAAADQFSNQDITLSWTIGEGVIETFSNNEMVLTQGFLQPNLKVTAITESEDANMSISV